MIELDNVGQFIEGINAFVAESKALAEGAYQGLVIEAFKFCVEGTPQWTGNLVAEWVLTVGAPAEGYTESEFKKTGWARLRSSAGSTPAPYSRKFSPNLAAMEQSKAAARAALPFLRRAGLTANFYITNTTPYAAVVQAGGGKYKIRLVNTPILMVDAAETHFGGLGALSEAQALELAGATL